MALYRIAENVFKDFKIPSSHTGDLKTPEPTPRFGPNHSAQDSAVTCLSMSPFWAILGSDLQHWRNSITRTGFSNAEKDQNHSEKVLLN